MARLKELALNHIKDAGNVKEGLQRFKNDVVSWIKSKEITSSDIHIREIFDATVMQENPDLDLATIDTVGLAEAIGPTVFPSITGELIASELLPAYQYRVGEVEDLVSVGTTKRWDYEYIAGMRAITKMPRVYPGQQYPLADWGEKKVRVEIAKFGQILELEKELIISDQTGQLITRAQEAGATMGDHRHEFIIDTVTDNARTALEESSSTAMYYDGSTRTVYANDHSSWDAYANDNLAASSALGTAGLRTVYGLFGTMQDERGRYINAMPKQILVHPTKYPEAWQHVTDISMPDAVESGSNFFKSKLGLKAYQSPYIGGNTTDWYVGDFQRANRWLWFQKPKVDKQGKDSDAAFERDVVLRFKYSYSGGCCIQDYRFLVKATA